MPGPDETPITADHNVHIPSTLAPSVRLRPQVGASWFAPHSDLQNKVKRDTPRHERTSPTTTVLRAQQKRKRRGPVWENGVATEKTQYRAAPNHPVAKTLRAKKDAAAGTDGLNKQEGTRQDGKTSAKANKHQICSKKTTKTATRKEKTQSNSSACAAQDGQRDTAQARDC